MILDFANLKYPIFYVFLEMLDDAIIEEAQRQGVHIAKDPQLAALLSQLELDREVPENLYVAVAVVLSWVYWLKGLEPEGYKK